MRGPPGSLSVTAGERIRMKGSSEGLAVAAGAIRLMASNATIRSGRARFHIRLPMLGSGR